MQNIVNTFQADNTYAPGTLVVLGGDQQVTITTKEYDSRVLGVVSGGTAEATAVVTNGMTQCQVVGPLNKGDLLVTSRLSGVAQKLITTSYQPGCVVGKSLENVGNNMKIINIIVGVQ